MCNCLTLFPREATAKWKIMVVPQPPGREPYVPPTRPRADPTGAPRPGQPLLARRLGEEGGASRLPQPMNAAAPWSDPRRGSPLVAAWVSAHRTLATQANREAAGPTYRLPGRRRQALSRRSAERVAVTGGASPPRHHGARRVAGRVRAALSALGASEGTGVRAHSPALGVRVPLPAASLAHLRHLLLRARLGGIQAEQRAAPARAARAGHPEAGEQSGARLCAGLAVRRAAVCQARRAGVGGGSRGPRV